MNTKSLKRIIKTFLFLMRILIIVLLVSYLGLRIWIKSDIDKYANNAISQYGGDRVEALISVLNSNTTSLKNKNSAVWALGYIGDERALVVLKDLQTGKKCNHSNSVCQRQLMKSIAHIESTGFDLMDLK